MSLLDLLRFAPPRPAADVAAQAVRAVQIVDQQLHQIVKLLDRPTQPPRDAVEAQALSDLRRSALTARIALRRSIR